MILLIAISPQNSGDFNQIFYSHGLCINKSKLSSIFSVINKLIKKRFLAKKRKTITIY